MPASNGDVKARNGSAVQVFIPVYESVLQRPDVSVGAALVHGYIASFQMRGKTAFPTRAAIAESTRMSVEMVKRHIRKLAELGLLEMEPRFKNGGQISNLYVAVLPPGGVTGDPRGGSSSTPQLLDELLEREPLTRLTGESRVALPQAHSDRLRDGEGPTLGSRKQSLTASWCDAFKKKYGKTYVVTPGDKGALRALEDDFFISIDPETFGGRAMGYILRHGYPASLRAAINGANRLDSQPKFSR